MLAVRLHWPEEVAPPPGCVPLRDGDLEAGSQAGWRDAGQESPGAGAQRIWRLGLSWGSPTVDRNVVPISERISFNNFIHCQHRSRVGHRAGATSSGWL